mgnify:CR=1 FL=1
MQAQPAAAPAAAPVSEVLGLAMSGSASRAAPLARTLLAADPANYDAALALAILAAAQRNASEARKGLTRAIEIDPDRPEAHVQLALLHWKGARLDDAQSELETAARGRPPSAEAHFRLGDLSRERGRIDEAIGCYRSALRIDPAHGEAHNNLGGLLRERGQADEALAAFREATRLRPTLAAAWFNLGTLLRDRAELDPAIAALRTSISLDAKQADAQYWLGNALMGRGDAGEASEAYRAALRIDAQLLVARWGLTMAQIVPVPVSVAAARDSRAAFGRELDKLAAWCRANRPADGFRAVGAQQPYYLAYQQQSNKELLARYGNLCTELLRPWEKKVGLPAPAHARAGRCKVGIVSAHFQNHSVWNAIVRGWVEHFDRAKIELHLFHVGEHQDAETAFARRRADKFHDGRRDWTLWAKAISESRLDALIYPEVGMDSITAKLAAAHLAPVQLASWGHPETTGLPRSDHFGSAAGMGPPDAALRYTERLAGLPGLGCRSRRFDTAPTPFEPASLGIPKGTRILLCPGMPFKYTPEHDALFIEIARRAAPCRLLFFRSRPEALSVRLEERLRKAFAAEALDFDAHVMFIPWQNQAAFFGLMRAADVFLDSPGFSGFNTAMQAVECGLPIVAFEGAFLRGRFASGILEALDLGECVARTHAAYVEQVVRVAGDHDLRQSLRKRIESRRQPLFEAVANARAMQDFILRVAG